MKNINDAIKLEKKIIKLTKSLKINIIYNLGNTNHKEIFKVNNNNLENVIKKIEEIKNENLKIENDNLKLKLELLKLSN